MHDRRRSGDVEGIWRYRPVTEQPSQVKTEVIAVADTVTVYQRNDTGANVNLASGTLRVRVRKQ